MQKLSSDLRLLIVALSFSGFAEGLATYILPLYLRELGADAVGIGSTLALATLPVALTHIPASYLGDRLGRKEIIVSGYALCAVSTLVMFLARDLRLFAAGLMVYYFTGFVTAPLNAYIAQARGRQSVQRTMTLVLAGYWSVRVFSPAVGGFIGQVFGLRMVFGVSFVAFALTFLIMSLLHPQPHSRAARDPVRYAVLLRNRKFLEFLALVYVVASVVQLGMPLAPNFVVEARGFDVGLVGLLGSANSLGAVILNLAWGGQLPRRAFVLGLAVLSLSLFLLLTMSSLPWLLLAFVLRGGWFLASNMITAQIAQMIESSVLGLGMGIRETILGLSSILSSFMAGVLYHWAPTLPFQISLGLIVLTLPFVWALTPRWEIKPVASRS